MFFENKSECCFPVLNAVIQGLSMFAFLSFSFYLQHSEGHVQKSLVLSGLNVNSSLIKVYTWECALDELIEPKYNR